LEEFPVAFSIIFSLTVILGCAFLSIRKNLHPFEILFIWMVVIIIHHNFITMTAGNLKLFDVYDNSFNYWTMVFMRTVLIPLLIVFYFDRMVVRRPYQQWVWLPLGILILTGLEYLAESLGVYRLSGWKMWWSLIEWLAIFLLIHFPWLWYRRLLAKEVK
jgi:hypothetical protein